MKIQILLNFCFLSISFVGLSQSTTTHQEYIEGRLIKTMNQEGITVSTSLRSTRNQFGKFYFFDVSISNGSNNTVTFKVGDCKATNVVINERLLKKGKLDKAYTRKDLTIMKNKEFQKIINRKQAWQSFFQNTTSWMRAKDAGKVTSSTETNFTNTNVFSNKSTIKSTTQENYGLITYIAQENEEKKLQEFRKQQYNIRSAWNKEYIKSNTLSPLESCSGILLVSFEEGNYFELLIKVDSFDFNFQWSSEDSEF